MLSEAAVFVAEVTGADPGDAIAGTAAKVAILSRHIQTDVEDHSNEKAEWLLNAQHVQRLHFFKGIILLQIKVLLFSGAHNEQCARLIK